MPSLEQPSHGQTIKKSGEKITSNVASGMIVETNKKALASLRAKVLNPEKIEKITTATKNPEERKLRVIIRNLEKKLDNASPEEKEALETRIDAAQTELASLLSSKFAQAELEKNTEIPKEEIEQAKQETEIEEKTKKHLTLLDEKIKKEKNPVENKKLHLQAEAVRENETEKLTKVREKIAEKPADEVYLSNWPKKEEKKPEEKPFTETEEAWFEQGEKADENRKKVKELEKDVRILKRGGKETMAKIAEEDLAAAKAETPEGAEELSKGVGRINIEKSKIAATRNITEQEQKLEDAKKELEKKGIDVDSITGGWFNRTQIKLQFGGFFSKKGKEIGALYDAYVKAKEAVTDMTQPTGDATKQKLRGLSSGGKGHSGGGFFKGR